MHGSSCCSQGAWLSLACAGTCAAIWAILFGTLNVPDLQRKTFIETDCNVTSANHSALYVQVPVTCPETCTLWPGLRCNLMQEDGLKKNVHECMRARELMSIDDAIRAGYCPPFNRWCSIGPSCCRTADCCQRTCNPRWVCEGRDNRSRCQWEYDCCDHGGCCYMALERGCSLNFPSDSRVILRLSFIERSSHAVRRAVFDWGYGQDYAGAKARAETYRAMHSLPCYYNPRDPTDVTLDRTPRWGLWLVSSLFAGMALIGLCLACYLMWDSGACDCGPGPCCSRHRSASRHYVPIDDPVCDTDDAGTIGAVPYYSTYTPIPEPTAPGGPYDS